MDKIKTYGLTHLAISVSNIDQTLQFYQKVFGMQVMYHEKNMIQLTTPGCNDILVFEENKNHLIGTTGGIAHIGFRLREPEDIGEMNEKIIQAGGTIIDKGDFVPGSPYIFFKDPDGYVVEVWYELLTEDETGK
jgi:catechol 2,3-dioxygenase-like lactoylglutathione lyase family enzyme